LKKTELEDEVIAKVKQLRERWQCSVADGLDFFYWTHDEPKHFFLQHEHFRAWAQALVCCFILLNLKVFLIYMYVVET
jgi:hypothetical protein